MTTTTQAPAAEARAHELLRLHGVLYGDEIEARAHELLRLHGVLYGDEIAPALAALIY